MSQFESTDDSSSEETKPNKNKRIKKIPKRFDDFYHEQELQQNKGIILKCSQTGKKIRTQIKYVTKSDMSPLVMEDFKKGSSLVVDIDGKPYPAEFVEFISEKGSQRSSADTKQKASFSRKRTALEAAKKELDTNSSKVAKITEPPTKETTDEYCDDDALALPPDNSAKKNLLIIVDKKIDSVLEKLDMLEGRIEQLEVQSSASSSMIETSDVDNADNNEYIVNGIDIRSIHATSALSYGRSLLDILFTRQELHQSVVYSTPKSSRPQLNSEKIDLLMNCVKTRYPEINMKELIRNLNQKCRDAVKMAPSKNITKQEPSKEDEN